MEKTKYLYLIKHLSKTYKKNHENYVINRIYNLVNNCELVPESQRFIKVENKRNKYHLIDLYFPQINVGIECDEAHHLKQKEFDAKREMSITDVLTRVRDDSTYYPIHIDVTSNDYDIINAQINKAVYKIKERINLYEKKNNTHLNFNNYLDGMNFDRNKTNIISIHDDYRFRIINDINILILNRHTKNQQHCYYRINDKYYLWCPKLVLDNGKAPTKWVNVLSNDGNIITEFDQSNYNKDYNSNDKDNYLRVTFAKVQDPVTRQQFYKFVGIFQGVKTIDGKRIYKLVDDKFNIIK